jgi:hypothetical protein
MHPVPVGEEAADQVGADEAGAARQEDTPPHGGYAKLL